MSRLTKATSSPFRTEAFDFIAVRNICSSLYSFPENDMNGHSSDQSHWIEANVPIIIK